MSGRITIRPSESTSSVRVEMPAAAEPSKSRQRRSDLSLWPRLNATIKLIVGTVALESVTKASPTASSWPVPKKAVCNGSMSPITIPMTIATTGGRRKSERSCCQAIVKPEGRVAVLSKLDTLVVVAAAGLAASVVLGVTSVTSAAGDGDGGGEPAADEALVAARLATAVVPLQIAQEELGGGSVVRSGDPFAVLMSFTSPGVTTDAAGWAATMGAAAGASATRYAKAITQVFIASKEM